MINNIKSSNEAWNEYTNNYNRLVEQMEKTGLDIGLLDNLIRSISKLKESSKKVC